MSDIEGSSDKVMQLRKGDQMNSGVSGVVINVFNKSRTS